ETRSYDDLNRLKLIATTDSATGALVFSAGYVPDNDGHRKSVTEHRGTATRYLDYTYDNLGRLTKETITDQSAGNRTIQYTYDLAGNRLTKTDTGAAAGLETLYSIYDDDDRLREVSNKPIEPDTGQSPGSTYTETYGYDDAGNTTSRTVKTYDSVGNTLGTQTT